MANRQPKVTGAALAAHRWAKLTPEERRQMIRAERLRHFEAQADPEGKLSPEERERRGYELFRAHMAELGRRGGMCPRVRREQDAA